MTGHAPADERTRTPPTAYLLAGLPGSGKSTFARRLEANGVVRLSVDAAMIASHGRIGLGHRVEDHVGLLGPVLADVRLQLRALLGSGSSVVLDHGLGSRAERDDWKAEVESAGGGWRLIYFEAEEATLLRRLAGRSAAGCGESMPISPEMLRYLATVNDPPSGEGEEPPWPLG